MSLARMNGMTNLAIIERAIATIGLESTVLALLVTGQHLADDEIRRTPEIYFRGLVKRGREGDLNLGHSIFGRREVAGLNVSGMAQHGADLRQQRSAAPTVNLVGSWSC